MDARTDRHQPETRPGPLLRMMAWVMPRMSPWHVLAYRAVGGKLLDRATLGAPVALVTTTGRRSGRRRTVPIGHLRDGDDLIIVGSNGGRRPDPAWVHNLRARPEAVIQVGSERFEAGAEFLEGSERDRYWHELVTRWPSYADASRWSGRNIPVIRLRRRPATGDT